MRSAFITGISGQDGSYLAELLLSKGYVVHGLLRRASSFNTSRIDHIYHHPRLHLHHGDVTDGMRLVQILSDTRPNEVYNLAAQSHVKVSFELPEYTACCDALGALKLLEAIRCTGLASSTRFYQASTSELFGKVSVVPQNETTTFAPRSPYACAKLYAHWTTCTYRTAYRMFACNGILFNHESPRRGPTFVTQKIVKAAVRMLCGDAPSHAQVSDDAVLLLGNLDAKRDWGHARDYVEGMHAMLQVETPDDYVLATGEHCSVRDFCTAVFAYLGVSIRWEGSGLHEVGIGKCPRNGNERTYIRVHERYFRPAEVDSLLGDASKALRILGWAPRTTFQSLVKEMVDAEVAAQSKQTCGDNRKKEEA